MQRILFTSTPLPKSIPSIFYSKIGEFKVLFKNHENYQTEKNFSFPSRVSLFKKKEVYITKCKIRITLCELEVCIIRLIPLNRANTYWTRSCKDGVVVVVVVNPWNVSFYPAGPFVHRFIMQLPPFHRSAGGGRGDQGKAVN